MKREGNCTLFKIGKKLVKLEQKVFESLEIVRKSLKIAYLDVSCETFSKTTMLTYLSVVWKIFTVKIENT